MTSVSPTAKVRSGSLTHYFTPKVQRDSMTSPPEIIPAVERKDLRQELAGTLCVDSLDNLLMMRGRRVELLLTLSNHLGHGVRDSRLRKTTGDCSRHLRVNDICHVYEIHSVLDTIGRSVIKCPVIIGSSVLCSRDWGTI